MSPRKRKLLKFGLLIGLPFLLVLGFWPYPEPPELPVRSYFIGFTNMPPYGLTARFVLSNYPRNEPQLPVVRDFAYQENAVWKPWLPALTNGYWPVNVAPDNRLYPNVIFNVAVPHTNHPLRLVLEFPAEWSRARTLLHRFWARFTSKSPPPPPRPPGPPPPPPNTWVVMNTSTGQVRTSVQAPPKRHRSLFFTNDTTAGPVTPPPLEVGELRGIGKPVHYGLRPK